MSYVVVIERLAPAERERETTHYIAFATRERFEPWARKTVRRGEWDVTDMPTMAFVFHTMKGAKGAVRSAIVRRLATNVPGGPKQSEGWRAAVYAVFGERGIRWTGKTLGPEVWPNRTDPVGSIATLATS